MLIKWWLLRGNCNICTYGILAQWSDSEKWRTYATLQLLLFLTYLFLQNLHCTGCPMVCVQSNTPTNFEEHWWVLIYFYVVNKWCIRFYLVYNIPWYWVKDLGKYRGYFVSIISIDGGILVDSGHLLHFWFFVCARPLARSGNRPPEGYSLE